MNKIEEILIIKVSNEKKDFEIKTDKKITIEEIKSKCIKEFEYSNENINNINLWFIDEDKDKNLIYNDYDLMTYVEKHEIEASKYLIKLNVDTNKIEEININKVEEINEKDKLIKNKNNYENDLKEKSIYDFIESLRNQIEILNNKINYYKERINKIISYYEDILDKKNNKIINKIVEQNIKNDEMNDIKKKFKIRAFNSKSEKNIIGHINNLDNKQQNKNIINNNNNNNNSEEE